MATKRKGLLVSERTREQLNLVKTQLRIKTGETLSQGDAIDWLIDFYNANIALVPVNEDSQHAASN